MREKRFAISKPYEGSPGETTPWGTPLPKTGLIETVEEYDDEFTARVRVAILNHGLAEKKYTLHEVDEGLWQEVDTSDDEEATP